MDSNQMKEISIAHESNFKFRENEDKLLDDSNNNYIFTRQESYCNYALSEFPDDKFDLYSLPNDIELMKYLAMDNNDLFSMGNNNSEFNLKGSDDPISTSSYFHENDVLFQSLSADGSPSPIIQKDCCFSAAGPSHCESFNDLSHFSVKKMQSSPSVDKDDFNISHNLNCPPSPRFPTSLDTSLYSDMQLSCDQDISFFSDFASPPATVDNMHISESSKKDHSYSSSSPSVADIPTSCHQSELLPGNIPKISLRSRKVQPTMHSIEPSLCEMDKSVKSSFNNKSKTSNLQKRYKPYRSKRINKANRPLYLPFSSYRQNETGKIIKAMKSSKKVKAYELEKFDDPKLERSRRNAINAKKNRDRKEQELIHLRETNKTSTMEIEKLRIENAELKDRLAEVESQVKAILAAKRIGNQSLVRRLAIYGILSIETASVQSQRDSA